MTFGDLELLPLNDGYFALDGGAMFGVIPKPLWERRLTADERNRVRLGLRPLLVRGVRTLLIDAGIGDKHGAKSRDIFGIDRTTHLHHGLAAEGLTATDVDLVLATHLHLDHAGGFTTRLPDGRLVPTFPRARYVARRGEWEAANAPNERTRASYLTDDFEPLAAAGVLELLSDDGTVMPGVKVQRTGGHTAHHQIVRIESGGRVAVFAADLLPTTAHLQEPWIMAYDLFPLETLAFKRAFVREAIEREYLVFFEHDPVVTAGYIREQGGTRTVEQVV